MTVPDSVFERFDDGVPEPMESVGLRGFSVLLAVGIVNPMGPTLAVLAADGPLDEGAPVRLLAIALNPFSQHCSVVGQVTVGETWDPVADALPFLRDLPVHSCPTLLFPNAWLDDADSVQLHSALLMKFDDGLELLGKVRKFPCLPVARVQADIDEVNAGVRGRAAGKPGSGRLNETTAPELAKLLLDPRAARAELQAFMYAWTGSIEFVGGAMGARAMPLPALARFLAELALTCRVPGAYGREQL